MLRLALPVRGAITASANNLTGLVSNNFVKACYSVDAAPAISPASALLTASTPAILHG